MLIEELIESVTIHADRLEVTVTGAPPLLITPGEVGLQDPGTGSLVSEGGLELRKADCPWLSAGVRSCPFVLVSGDFRRLVVSSSDV